MMTLILFVLFISYILGSLSTSFILARTYYKSDLKGMGTGNLGAMNTLRNFGTLPGVIVFIVDVLKGAAVVLIARYLNVHPLWGMAGVIAGHNFSFILKFKGGKGLASALGALLFIDPRYALIIITVGLITLQLIKNMYKASVVMAATFPFIIIFLDFTIVSVLLSLGISFLIIIKHLKNFSKAK